MKNFYFTISLFIVIFISCEKEEIDYREQYVGEYICDSNDTLVVSIININMYNNIKIDFNSTFLDESGYFSNPNHGFGSVDGYFEKDNLYITIRGGKLEPNINLQCVKLK